MNQNGGKLDYGDYAGVYMLTEKIKSNSARLPIVSPDPGETAGEALTGGYIFKIDRPDADEYRWTINNSTFGLGTLPNQESGQSLIIVEPDPDQDTTEQQNYLKNTAIQPFNDTLFQERATAFATRDKDFIVNVVARTPGPEGFAEAVEWARAATRGVGPDAASYVNFTGEASADQVRASYPKDTYERLLEVKNRYDPSNVFRLNQNLVPGLTTPRSAGGGS